ncbi:MAG: hypothetical protein IKS51_05050 [Erysipelotrichaceae bacterium]|nr:hypothetical protein [Erysipelotrichaceae bacterium]
MTSLILKIVAMVSMLIDHVNAAYPGILNEEFAEIAGRIAFPIYAFMIVDSFRHLSGKRLKRFMIILGVMAVVSEPAFDKAFYGAFYFPWVQNQLPQFFTYGLTFICAGKIKTDWQKVLIWILAITANQVCCLGYGGGGIVLMLMYLWYLKHHEGQSPVWRFGMVTAITLLAIPVLALSVFVLYFGMPWQYHLSLDYILDCLKVHCPMLLTIPIIVLYSGEYGNIPKWFRIVYRYFYPVHIWILTFIKLFI